MESRGDVIGPEFIKIAELCDLTEGKGAVRKLDDDSVALVRLGDTVHAFLNTCPHQHTPLIDKYGGQIAGEEITCSMHGWKYNLRTGSCVNESGRLKLLEVQVEDGGIYVRRPVSKGGW